MGSFIDLTGQKFGDLTVISQAEKRHGKTHWLCRCICNTEKAIATTHLRSGATVSCGCRLSKGTHATHLESKSRLYRVWGGMIQRTTNPKQDSYKNYGGRSELIAVCPEWRDSYEAFASWARANGYADGLTIDRRSNEKGYFPDNCRWISKKEQARNKRNNRFLTIGEETRLLLEWSEITGIHHETLQSRYERGEREDQLLRPVGGPDKLTEQYIEEIKALLRAKVTQPVIAKMYNVGPKIISKIQHGAFELRK
jgi:hypothetical protein